MEFGFDGFRQKVAEGEVVFESQRVADETGVAILQVLRLAVHPIVLVGRQHELEVDQFQRDERVVRDEMVQVGPAFRRPVVDEVGEEIDVMSDEESRSFGAR